MTIKKPEEGKIYLCRLRQSHTKEVQEHLLKKVKEGDCDWRTVDDNSEISYMWDVVEWTEQPTREKSNDEETCR